MTIELPETGTPAEDMLRKAQADFAKISANLELGIAKLNEATDPEVRAFSNSLALYWKSLLSVRAQEKQLETQRRECAGISDGHALDLAEARREVGRRLACLAAAGGD